MGSGYSYKEYGNTFDNTVCTSDITSLKIINKNPNKISHLRIYINEYIVGFECFYDSFSAGARLGFEYESAETKDFELSPEEYIIRITGTSKEVIDSLTFYTTNGRHFRVGTERIGGKRFELSKDNKIVTHFVVGFGRYMHKIGAYFTKRPRVGRRNRNMRYNQSGMNSNVSMMSSNTARLRNNASVLSAYNNQSFESTVSYERGIVVNPQNSNVMPSLTVQPQRYNSRVSTAPSYSLNRSQTTNSRAISNSLLPSQVVPVMRREVKAERTHFGGLKYENTVEFDDYNKLIKGHSSVSLSEIRILHDEFCVYGVQSIYVVDGVKISDTHCKRPLPSGVKNEVIIVNAYDYIISIEGTHSDIVNSLTITLLSGKTFKFGKYYLGETSDKQFKLEIPRGKKCLAIAGGYNSYLHFIGCYYV